MSRQDAAMFDPYSNSNRAAPPSTELEEWARREAKSDSMAHDLLRNALTTGDEQRASRPRSHAKLQATLLTIGVAAALIFWLL